MKSNSSALCGGFCLSFAISRYVKDRWWYKWKRSFCTELRGKMGLYIHIGFPFRDPSGINSDLSVEIWSEGASSDFAKMLFTDSS